MAIKNRKSIKTTAPIKQNSIVRRKQQMSPPGGFGKRRRYGCGGKVKK